MMGSQLSQLHEIKQKINREKNKNRLVQDTWKKIHKSVKAVYGGRICSQVLSLE